MTRTLQPGDGPVTLRRTLRPGTRYTVALRLQDAAGNVTLRTLPVTAPRA